MAKTIPLGSGLNQKKNSPCEWIALSYHIALELIANNLHTILLIDNILIFYLILCFQIPYNQILRLGTIEV